MKRYAKSTCELRVQRLNESPGSMRLENPEAVAAYWREKIAAMPWHDPEREVCVAVLVNTRHSPLGHALVGIGSINECVVHPRDVFRAAVAAGAYGVILIHNHPSGDAAPSSADHRITEQLRDAGRLLQIPLIDHVVVGAEHHYSFREAGCV